jgi:hypothetical protein
MGYLELVVLPCVILVVIVALPTAAFAFLVTQFRFARFARFAPGVIFTLIGSIIPVLMVVLAVPKGSSDALHDGVPPGMLLILAAGPAWIVCLATSHIVGRRFARGKA